MVRKIRQRARLGELFGLSGLVRGRASPDAKNTGRLFSNLVLLLFFFQYDLIVGHVVNVYCCGVAEAPNMLGHGAVKLHDSQAPHSRLVQVFATCSGLLTVAAETFV